MIRRLRRTAPVTRHMIVALMILMLVVIIGVIGYVLIEDLSFTKALYMTIITISTVGFKEVTSLSTAGMYFTIIIIIIGVSAVLFFLGVVFEFILSEYLGDIWGRRRMKTSIAKLSNHQIICGFGRVGRSVVHELTSQEQPFVVIEKDPEVYRECVEQGNLAVHGSATEREVLIEAGILQAVGLVSALRSGADNVYVILSAKVLNPDLLLVARADSVDSEQKLEMVGADRVIAPYSIAGRRMANLLIRPNVCEFVDVGDTGTLPEYHMREMRIDAGSPLKGKLIRECRLRETTGVIILATRKSGEKEFDSQPSPDTRIEEGDVLIVIGTPDQMKEMESDLRLSKV